jgi:hypothetical protein
MSRPVGLVLELLTGFLLTRTPVQLLGASIPHPKDDLPRARPLRFLFHLCGAYVVIRDLVEVREGNPGGRIRIIVGDVPRRICSSVLQFDIHTGARLRDVNAAVDRSIPTSWPYR